MKKITVFALIFWVFSAVAWANGTTAPVGQFDVVDVNGWLDVHLMGGKEDSVHVVDPARVTTEVRNNTLFIRPVTYEGNDPAEYMPRAKVRVVVSNLHQLRVAGDADVKGDGIVSDHLVLTVRDASSVRLGGTINLVQLWDKSSGEVAVHWVNSPRVMVRVSSTGTVRLGGVAELMDARVADGAFLDAKYLRAGKVYIQALHQSVVELAPVQDLYAFADDESNIYYYKAPWQASKYSRLSGNVLQLGNWK